MEKVILIADDDRANLMIAKKILPAEYKVAAVNSGKMVFQYLEKYIPDLILLDIQMPEIDGFEVVTKLKETKEWKDIPIAFLSGDQSDESKKKGFELGVNDYIKKPYIPEQMRQQVKTILENPNGVSES